jgi:hypothetical protein
MRTFSEALYEHLMSENFLLPSLRCAHKSGRRDFYEPSVSPSPSFGVLSTSLWCASLRAFGVPLYEPSVNPSPSFIVPYTSLR